MNIREMALPQQPMRFMQTQKCDFRKAAQSRGSESLHGKMPPSIVVSDLQSETVIRGNVDSKNNTFGTEFKTLPYRIDASLGQLQPRPD